MEDINFVVLADAEIPSLDDLAQVCCFAFSGMFVTVYKHIKTGIIYKHFESITGSGWHVESGLLEKEMTEDQYEKDMKI